MVAINLDGDENELDWNKLRVASDKALAKTQNACERRMKMLERLVGPYYPGHDIKDRKRRPVNMIELGVDIFLRGLASHEPQALIQTDYEELVPTASDFETIFNRRLCSLKLQEELETCAIEALFTVGVMCVGIGIDDENDTGRSFAEAVLFPDLILDLNAKSWERQSFVGHEFLVPLDWLYKQENVDEKTRDQFVAYCNNKQTSNGRDWNRDRVEEFDELVKLRQLYLPRHKKIVLFACEGPIKEPLSVSDWVGPECGPYIPLSFRKVPGNVFPLAPVPMWYDLDDFVNTAYTKAFRQSDRCKTIGLARDDDDAKAVTDAHDGEVKSVKDPDSVVERTFGGANQNIIAAANLAQKLLTYVGGNWDALGGLAPSSGTVGQDELLTQGAGGRMKEMQKKMTKFETTVINALAFWEWNNSVGEERFTKRLQGTSFGLPDQVWSRSERKGDFYQLNLTASPYARVDRSPSEQAAFITDFLERVILPALPYMQQQGPVDWEYFFKMQARYNNTPEINMLINWPGGESMPQPMPETPGMPRNTKRTYERVNTSGGSRNPLDDAMQGFAESSADRMQSAQPMAS